MYLKPDGWSGTSNSADRYLVKLGTSTTTDSGADGSGQTGSMYFVYTSSNTLDVVLDIVTDDSSGAHSTVESSTTTLVSDAPLGDSYWSHVAISFELTDDGFEFVTFFDGFEYSTTTVYSSTYLGDYRYTGLEFGYGIVGTRPGNQPA